MYLYELSDFILTTILLYTYEIFSLRTKQKR